MNSNINQACQSLRHLDVMVAEHLFGWRWYRSTEDAEWYRFTPTAKQHPSWVACENPHIFTCERLALNLSDPLHPHRMTKDVPHYTTWSGLEQVIQNREEAGFSWSIEKTGKLYLATMTPTKDSSGYLERIHPIREVAFCLVALTSEGVEVTFKH